MTIEIEPELETAIQQRMASGAFRDVNDVLSHALGSLPPRVEAVQKTAGEALIEAFEPIRGLLTDDEVDALFARDRSPARDIDLR